MSTNMENAPAVPLNIVSLRMDYFHARPDALPRFAEQLSLRGSVTISQDCYLVPGAWEELTLTLGAILPPEAHRNVRCYSLSAFSPADGPLDLIIRKLCQGHFLHEQLKAAQKGIRPDA